MLKINKKIKILYLAHPHIIGGIERFMFSLIKHLDRKKFMPLILSWKAGPAIEMFRRLDIEIKVIDIRYPKGLDSLTGFLKKSKVDITQTNHFFPALAMAADVVGIPHIWYPGGHINIAYPCLSLRQKRLFLNIFATLSTKIVCPSHFIKQQFKGIKTSDIKMIHYGVDLDEINNVTPDYNMLKRSGCADDCFTVGMIAHLVPQKRHIDFIYAAKRVKRCLPNTKFYIFGAPYPGRESRDYAKKLYKTVKDIKMDKDIIFAGFYKDILRTIASMNLVVLPSIDEGFGIAIIEAMAKAKPVIASNSGGIREIIKDGVCGYLVEPKNYERLAKAMIEILKDPLKAKIMGESGKKRVKRLFDIKTAVKKFKKLYQEI